jgi:molybdopterin adenylyltransferase
MPWRVGLLTLSDRGFKGEYQDLSGPAVAAVLKDWPEYHVEQTDLLPDDYELIRKKLGDWADADKLDLVLTIGGTGFGPRDITPEATRTVIERETPGLIFAMTLQSLQVTPHAMLSRMVAGIRGKTLIINLPGSPKAASENLATVLPALSHGLRLIAGEQLTKEEHERK